MNFTSLWLIALVGALCALPWLVKWMQRRTGRSLGGQGHAITLVSVLPLGPQQRVVTVEVGPAQARTQLVLGVTAQTVTCLHVLPAEARTVPVTSSFAVATGEAQLSSSFAQALRERTSV